MQGLAVELQPRRQARIRHRQNLGGQQTGIESTPNRHRGHRNATRHLHNGMQRIHPREGPTLHRYPDHGERSERCDHAGEMGRATGASHDHAEALIPGLLGEGHHLKRSAMGGEHTHLHRHPQILKGLHRQMHGGQVGIAAHDHRHPGLMRWRGWGGCGHGSDRAKANWRD